MGKHRKLLDQETCDHEDSRWLGDEFNCWDCGLVIDPDEGGTD